MLTYDEFAERARAAMPTVDREGSGLVPFDCFWAAWRTCGAQGGNCWGGEPERIEPEEEPDDLLGLLRFLEDMDVTIQHGVEILSDAERGEKMESGYYGNWTDWSFKYLTIDALHEKLVALGYVQPREKEPSP